MGDTPAMCLTQDIPPSFHGRARARTTKRGDTKGKEKEGEKENDRQDDNSHNDQKDPISILLLGCGDLRKILFTVNHDTRNTLFLTLLIDMNSQPPLSPSLQDLFPIYYHLYLPPRLASLIASQARKLIDVSDSLQTWHASTYGREGIRFCDSYSLSRAREVWQCWAQFDGNEDPAVTDVDFKAKFEADLAATRGVKTDERVDSTGYGLIYTAVRSVAPAGDEDMRHLNDLHQRFWRVGSLSPQNSDAVNKESRQVNPMFVTPDVGRVRMHWGLDPLLGFPLAEAYTRTMDEPENVSAPQKVVALVMEKFAAWCQSFKDAWAERSVVTRWFVGDAIAFGHTLQGCANGRTVNVHWYRSRHSFRRLKFDGEDYQPGSFTPAPLSFMVIDTSNLIDDLGALNVLVATSPLLENNLAATIYTEMLTRYHRTYKDEADNLLCGPISTVALLLGLFCVEYSTNTSPYHPSQDAMTYQMMEYGSSLPTDMPPKLYQPYERLRWKRPIAH
ncbi:hypothetical protein NEUTE1DRAFT_124328 [Neurospora tetrasperma FGSC 2508]|uniref:DUF4470 domain-containing protein n=1 Tax=Neurospora tetrasperma (strain FGSC 2508 / ATCC MYA-4615 / P0657) TaxID=510951 RepID=F8MVH0_NEUT8|nr:uncharacterized protein NEUTE1DRAFT_124328 [Neurospora tetrasperma FGSC 2508]EGO53922.1 hypothetical protein NEUTE1DRAFT_124328 [Neurospora tetrasperma FGSC 2508]EGZ68664.1 hypothetical protein NEUTE2DRAFT_118688 [Neurospora tetrasperma FGSC 2509]